MDTIQILAIKLIKLTNNIDYNDSDDKDTNVVNKDNTNDQQHTIMTTMILKTTFSTTILMT